MDDDGDDNSGKKSEYSYFGIDLGLTENILFI